MRWLLDQGLPLSTASLLTQAGEDAVHVSSIGMAMSPDVEIINRARSDERLAVTLDADFHALMAVSGARMPSIVRIREEGLKGQQAMALIREIGAKFSLHLAAGCLLTYMNGSVRLRRLPLVNP